MDIASTGGFISYILHLTSYISHQKSSSAFCVASAFENDFIN